MIVRGPYPDVEVPEISVPEFVLQHAEERGAALAVIDGATGSALSHRELASEVRRVAAGLRAHGVAGGDVLALCSPNGPEFVVTYYAATLAGAVLTTVNPAATGGELAAQLTAAGARWLVTSSEIYTDKGRDAVAGAGLQGVFVHGTANGAIPFASLSETHGTGSVSRVSADDLALLPYSSGTGGLPKGVMLTHRQLVSNLCQMGAVKDVRADDVAIAALPLSHVYGMQVTMNLVLRAGGTVVTMPRFSLDAFLGALEAYRVTRADVVPPIVLELANQPAVDRYDLSSLRLITSGAAPLGLDLARACANRLGCRVRQAYGMTELGGCSHVAPDLGRDEYGSVGPPIPGVECRVIDTVTGADAAAGQPGELLVRSPAAMLGYLNDPDATKAMIDADNWVHTGDIVTADEQGWFTVVDRAKEMIKYKGYQVAPAELEAILSTHPSVADCAVIASPDPEAGEVPKAFVVLRPGSTADGLLDWLAQRVAPYRKVRLLQITGKIPRSASGKILRRVLRDAERDAVDQAPAGARFMTAALPSPLDGRVALVTGASRGLGRVIAATLARSGAAVGLVARSAEGLAQTRDRLTAGGGTAVAVTADVTDAEDLAAAVSQVSSQLGPIDVLVNNAGIAGPYGAQWEIDPALWWQTMEVNVRSVIACTRLVLPSMIARRRGCVVNIASNAGAYRWPLASAYAVSKAAVIKLTENLGVELRDTGVTVFSVHPGLLPIGLSERALAGYPPEDPATVKVNSWVRTQLAKGRGTEPEVAAGLVLRLASGECDSLFGRYLTVDDDLDALIERAAEVSRGDLYTLRRSELDGSLPRRPERGSPGGHVAETGTRTAVEASRRPFLGPNLPRYCLGIPTRTWGGLMSSPGRP